MDRRRPAAVVASHDGRAAPHQVIEAIDAQQELGHGLDGRLEGLDSAGTVQEDIGERHGRISTCKKKYAAALLVAFRPQYGELRRGGRTAHAEKERIVGDHPSAQRARRRAACGVRPRVLCAFEATASM